MDNLFNQLIKEDVCYFVWKDTDKVRNFFDGNAELDLLVSSLQKGKFEELVYKNGFIPLKLVDPLKLEGVNHYIKFEHGKYFHLHVYYELITGNHYVKEYHFLPDEGIFDNFVCENDIKVVNNEVEIAFISIRLFIKGTLIFSKIKESEKKRLQELTKNYNVENVSKIIGKIAPGVEESTKELLNISLGRIVSKEIKKTIKERFENFKRLNGLKFVTTYLKIRFNLIMLRLHRSSNKTLSGRGISFAILGSDGSGKTTITSSLFKQYSAKTSSRKFYLGSNFRTYSIITRFYYFNYYFARVFSPLKEKYSVAWFLYYNAVSLLELGKAKDREKKVLQGIKLKNKGWIVLFERYPIVGLFDFPNNLNELRSHKFYHTNEVIDKRIVQINKIISNLEKPDISFLVIANLDNMKKRRDLAPNEIIDINRKLKVQKQFLSENKQDIFVIENNEQIEKAISTINNEINRNLCIFSS